MASGASWRGVTSSYSAPGVLAEQLSCGAESRAHAMRQAHGSQLPGSAPRLPRSLTFRYADMIPGACGSLRGRAEHAGCPDWPHILAGLYKITPPPPSPHPPALQEDFRSLALTVCCTYRQIRLQFQ